MDRVGVLRLVLALPILSLALLGGCPQGDNAGGDDENSGVLGGLFGGGSSGGTIFNDNPTASFSYSPNAGIRPGVAMSLDASASSDPDGDALEFEWSQVSGPTGTFSSTSDVAVSFTTPYVVENNEVKLALVVRDGRGGEASAEAAFIVEVSSEFAGHPQAASEYRNSLTSDEAYHLLRRAALGATPEQVAAAVQRGLFATVDDLLTAKPVPEAVTLLADSYEENIPKRWLVHLIESPNPLHERMAMFWHDRFATSQRVISDWRDRNLGVFHWQMLRRNALGDYRQFLIDLTLDPLMLIWLDGANSPKTSPNENYAREFWELFTLGRDRLYTEADIRESARAFTGITLLRDWEQDTRPIYDLLNHDETNKMIFAGRTSGPANYSYQSVVDLTLAQPEASEYVARNLFAFFVHDHPSDALVKELADSFVASNFQIAPLVRKILVSQALFSPDARGNQVTTPVEHFVGVARTLDMHVYSEDSQGYLFDQLADDLSSAGQDLLNPPGVEGWSEDLGWVQDQWILSRVKALGRTMDYGPNHTEDVPFHLLPAVENWSQREVRPQIVDAIAGVFHLPLTQEEKDIYMEVLDQGGWRAFHLEDPDYQARHVYEMIRLMAMDERVIGR
ncbi:MAG: hypothetical protein CHACPFDD_01349 [Phycisphaerae bacterium]|nr:hypothetical protein [Phycisphaerae bacterium]